MENFVCLAMLGADVPARDVDRLPSLHDVHRPGTVNRTGRNPLSPDRDEG